MATVENNAGLHGPANEHNWNMQDPAGLKGDFDEAVLASRAFIRIQDGNGFTRSELRAFLELNGADFQGDERGWDDFFSDAQKAITATAPGNSWTTEGDDESGSCYYRLNAHEVTASPLSDVALDPFGHQANGYLDSYYDSEKYNQEVWFQANRETLDN